MKIHICSKIKEGVWGGGNQFLKALRTEFIKQGVYADSINQADAVIFNSYQDLWQLIKYYVTKKKGNIIYRLGPIFYLHRGWKWRIVDVFVILVANLFVDLIIFQSKWSYEQGIKLGLNRKKKYFIIQNAVDGSIFFSEKNENKFEKIRLIYTSWSTNLNKGFNYLAFLDRNLDFKKYELKFVGNSPILFKNIKTLKPLPSIDLAKELRQSDIFISPAKDDACSNAILESLACGLPVVALDSGSNGELIGQAGILFNNEASLLSGIEKVSQDMDTYRNRIIIKDIKTVSCEYAIAIKSLYGSM